MIDEQVKFFQTKDIQPENKKRSAFSSRYMSNYKKINFTINIEIKTVYAY